MVSNRFNRFRAANKKYHERYIKKYMEFERPLKIIRKFEKKTIYALLGEKKIEKKGKDLLNIIIKKVKKYFKLKYFFKKYKYCS